MPAHALLYKCPHCGTSHEFEPHQEGEVINCSNPACGKPFKLEIPVAHPAEVVNEDHHDLIVSSQQTPANDQPRLILPPEAAPADGQTDGHPASLEAEHEVLPDASEQIILVSRPAMFRRFPLRFLCYLGALIAGIALFCWAWTEGSNLWFFEVVGIGVAAYGVFYLLPWWLRVHSTSLTVSNHRTLVVQGLLNKEQVEIAHPDLDHLEVHQNWFQRLIGVGDLDIITAEGKKNVSVMGLPNPQWVANQIRAQHPAVRHAPEDPSARPHPPPAAPNTAARVEE